MRRILIEEHLVFTKELYDDYFNNALESGVLAVENNKGNARMDMGIYYLNDVPKSNVSNDEVHTILWKLIQKYKTFSYTPHRFRTKRKYYEYEPESKTWEVYNMPSF